MNKEIIEGKYSFYRFYLLTFLQGMIFLLFVLTVERKLVIILIVLFFALVLYPLMASIFLKFVTSFRVFEKGIEINIIGFGRFIEWEEIKSASSQLGYLHISFSSFGTLQAPSPYFMENRDEIYKAIDKYAPKDSPIRKIIKNYNHTDTPNGLQP